MKKSTIEEGKCPHCGGEYIDYDPAEWEPGAVYYPATCNDCGCTWEEWYELKFSGQTSIKEPGKNDEA
jgi:predicted Zn-ribbon and HTH transcriptional regulator